MDQLFPVIDKWREEGKKVALATVVSVKGSSPRPLGATMAIAEGGAFAGSVSGGCLETDVMENALETLQDGQTRLLKYSIQGSLIWELGLSCGGQVEVLVEPLP